MNAQWVRQYTRLGWPTEMAFGYLVLVAANVLLFPGQPAFRLANPHPYLFLILLLAGRYGLTAGLTSGVAGTLLHWLWAKPHLRLEIWGGMDPVLINCVAFILAGTAFGYLRNRYLIYEANLRQALAAKEQEATSLAKKVHVLAEVQQELETRILNEVNTFSRLYDISRRLGKLDVGEICQAVPGLMAEHLEATSCSIYLWGGNRLRLQASHGWEAGMNYRQEIPLDGSLIGLACRDKRVLCVRDYLDQTAQLDNLGESVISAPLLGEQGQLLGAINIEAMPFMRINRSSITVVSVLAKWISEALGKAMYVAEVRAHAIIEELHEVYTRPYLDQRLAEEIDRSRSYFAPFALVLLSLRAEENQSPQSRVEELRLVVAFLRVACRKTDILCRYDDRFPLAVLMVATDEATAGTRRDQLERDLNLMLAPPPAAPRVRLGLACFRSSITTQHEFRLEAERAFEQVGTTVSA